MSQKIVVITQVYNELEKGNLERFFKYINAIADEVVVYDDASTDGSYEYCLAQTKHVIRAGQNNFAEEVNHKQALITYAKKLGAKYILSLDADEVLTKDAKKKLLPYLKLLDNGTYDGLNFRSLNIWRGATYSREDSHFGNSWPTRFWKVSKELGFPNAKPGLHSTLVPPQILRTTNVEEVSILHYGFADDLNIAYKYFGYKRMGQRGYLMLDRFLDEAKLKLERLDKKIFPAGLWVDEKVPRPRSFVESFTAVSRFKDAVRRPRYSIVCLIYKSVEWLKFVNEQVLKYTDLSDREFIFIANDPTPEVEKYLKNKHLPHYVYHAPDKHKDDWYINNVYRAWNYGAQMAQGDFIVFINSDMAFTPNWLENLVAGYNGHNCVASRLVESGKLRSGQHGIEKNFGRHFSEYKEKEFQKYAAQIASDAVMNGGLFMPLLIKRRDFLGVGGYPEGNMVEGSDIHRPVIAKKGERLISGDVVLMQKLLQKGVVHQTAFESVVYHFQTGEMDENAVDKLSKPVEIAVCNDLVTGTMGEKVLWDYLLESLPGTYGLDKRVVGSKNFEKKAKAFIDAKHPKTTLIIQNASFIGTIDKDRFTVAFLQDDLRKMGTDSVVQESNLQAAIRLVANSVLTAASYHEFEAEVISIGLNDTLFAPKNKSALRTKFKLPSDKRIGIFVGDFSEVKGWSKVSECIKKRPDIHWILVTKKNENYSATNATVYSRISQEKLSELINCADFFLLGSPVETQCLAALEAGLCNIPILMPLTGIFADWSATDRQKVGIFSDNLLGNIDAILAGKFSPRATIQVQCQTISDSMEKWRRFVARCLQEQASQHHLLGRARSSTAKKYRKYPIGLILRKKILKPLIGREYIFTSSVTFTLLKFIYRALANLGLEPAVKKVMQYLRQQHK